MAGGRLVADLGRKPAGGVFLKLRPVMPIEPEAFAVHQPAEFRLSGKEAGRLFAAAGSDVQAQFLWGMFEEIESWYGARSWAVQCRFIADKLSPEHATTGLKGRVVTDLETLLEHLKETH